MVDVFEDSLELTFKLSNMCCGWVGVWFYIDTNATLWPILQAERLARISAELSLQDGLSVAISESI